MRADQSILLAGGTFAALGYGAALGVVPADVFGAIAGVVLIGCGFGLALPYLTADLGELPCRTELDDYRDLGELEDRR